MPNNPEKFIQANSPDGGFLQSEEWRKFQESVARKTFHMEQDGFWANIIEHKLPIVGKYFYIPRGPVIRHPEFISGSKEMLKQVRHGIQELIDLARKENAGWIRFDPENEEALNAIRNNSGYKISKAPHDMQPKEVFIIDIKKPEEELLAQMKAKTRYNIKLAEKKGVKVLEVNNNCHPEQSEGSRDSSATPQNDYFIKEFLRLTKIMAERQGIAVHPEEYYRKMLETIPGDILKLYVAEFEGPASARGDDRSSTRGGKVIAANIAVHFGNTATYLHGASDDEYRNVMAPYLLQWRQIQDAKAIGCEKYDFGGIKIVKSSKVKVKSEGNSWAGITRFKTGFSPGTKPTEFPGSYDIIISRKRYYLYRVIQKIKSFL